LWGRYRGVDRKISEGGREGNRVEREIEFPPIFAQSFEYSLEVTRLLHVTSQEDLRL
jgi:hypothetical protein